MKKMTVISMLLVFAVFFSFSACTNRTPYETTESVETTETVETAETVETTESTDQKKVENLDSYSALLYANAPGGAVDNTTPQYTGDDFYAYEFYERSAPVSKTETILGKELNLHYSKSITTYMYPHEVDVYEQSYNNRMMFVWYRADTGKIVKYKRYDDCVDRNYKSCVNPDSTEAEFIAYAKQVLLDNAGVSADGWEVQITTARAQYGTSQGFINYSQETPEYNEEYTFTFYKTISGIERYDKMYIKMTNVGEIIEYEAMINNEAYKPFESAQIDRERLEAAAWSAFRHISSQYAVTSSNIESIYLISSGDDLWAQVTIEFRHVNGEYEFKSGVKYVIKVAELK